MNNIGNHCIILGAGMILTFTRGPLGTFRLVSGELSKNYLSLERRRGVA